MRQGRIESSHDARRIGQGNETRPLPRERPSHILRAAASASMKNGMGHVFLSVIPERTKPGHTTLTQTPSGARRPRSESPHALSAALEAAYAGQAASGARIWRLEDVQVHMNCVETFPEPR